MRNDFVKIQGGYGLPPPLETALGYFQSVQRKDRGRCFLIRGRMLEGVFNQRKDGGRCFQSEEGWGKVCSNERKDGVRCVIIRGRMGEGVF